MSKAVPTKNNHWHHPQKREDRDDVSTVYSVDEEVTGKYINKKKAREKISIVSI